MALSDPFKLVGRIVDGRYRVEEVAGIGGYGVVYRAFHLTFEAPIALKILKLPAELLPDRKRTHAAAFQMEGKVLFELSALHPSIVKAFEAGVVTLGDGNLAPYLALEWLDGVSLDREMKYRRKHGLAPFRLEEMMAMLDAPAAGLALAHARGVAHRDIKPGNLFATRGQSLSAVKILDFGVAKFLDDSMSTTTKLGETGPAASFTPMYGAPEQWLRRLGATGTWTDVHAWALVCVELITGKVPFEGGEAAQFMAACLDPSLRPTPSSLGVDLGGDVDKVFARALAIQPRERFRDIGEFWKALGDAAKWRRDAGTNVPVIASFGELRQPDEGAPSEPELTHGRHPSTTRATASRSIEQASPRKARPGFIRWLGIGVALGAALIVGVRGSKPPEPTPRAPNVEPAAAAPALSAPLERTEPPAVAAIRSDVGTSEPIPGPPPPLLLRPNAPSNSVGATPRKAREISPTIGPATDAVHADAAASPSGQDRADKLPVRRDGGSSLEQIMNDEELLHRR